ncbi:hypothetical protein PC117_g797 [Phytophthora cactorum]|uniref:Uncharacterized protein n=1 Tax=Phytophthora cactorum TaxID=29920 RepID=A0A8T1EST6_9STRA|nr:hypothetical protein PC117_g797 [Phytophthora cactorum]
MPLGDFADRHLARRRLDKCVSSLEQKPRTRARLWPSSAWNRGARALQSWGRASRCDSPAAQTRSGQMLRAQPGPTDAAVPPAPIQTAAATHALHPLSHFPARRRALSERRSCTRRLVALVSVS